MRWSAFLCYNFVGSSLYLGWWASWGLGMGLQNGFFSCSLSESEMLLRYVLILPNNVEFLACGHSHTLVYTKDGRIRGWGYNSYGQAATEKFTYAWYPSPVEWYVFLFCQKMKKWTEMDIFGLVYSTFFIVLGRRSRKVMWQI